MLIRKTLLLPRFDTFKAKVPSASVKPESHALVFKALTSNPNKVKLLSYLSLK